MTHFPGQGRPVDKYQTRSGSSRSWADSLGDAIPIDIDLVPLTQEAQLRTLAALESPCPDEDDLPVHMASLNISLPGVSHRASHETVAPRKDQVKDRDKARSKQRRRAARDREAKEASVAQSVGRRIKLVSRKRCHQAHVVHVNMNIQNAGTVPSGGRVPAEPLTGAVARTGFVGRRVPLHTDDRRPLTKADALELKFEYVAWDGREARPLLDSASRVFAVLVGSPRDAEGWAQVNNDAQQALDAARSMYKLDPKQASHRRGSFPAISAGISYGGGQKLVNNLVHSAHNQKIVSQLLSNSAIQRIAGFGDAAFKLYAPRMHEYYEETMLALLKDNPALKPNFQKSVFGSATFNLGPQVFTYIHTDHLNLPAGWCAISAIGNFDPKEGGHLLLWDLNLMIEFPPGALILIPSALLRHSNTVVRASESRSSFTQYSAGGLFRWVACGCQSQKDFFAGGGVFGIDGEERWLRGVGMWSMWDALRSGSK